MYECIYYLRLIFISRRIWWTFFFFYEKRHFNTGTGRRAGPIKVFQSKVFATLRCRSSFLPPPHLVFRLSVHLNFRLWGVIYQKLMNSKPPLTSASIILWIDSFKKFRLGAPLWGCFTVLTNFFTLFKLRKRILNLLCFLWNFILTLISSFICFWSTSIYNKLSETTKNDWLL